ncbi:hypothetical protein N0V86_000347 [Didymella sp. IMI 355093]|nr:hypothetical protein N0V86_000347 [Didymella sp. IMI 355093]
MPMTEQTSLSTGTKHVDIHGKRGTQENPWKSKHAPRYSDGTIEDLMEAGQKLEATKKKKADSTSQFEAGGTGTVPTGPCEGTALTVGLKRVRTLGPKIGVKDAEDRPKLDAD